jgi:hypothetical protein
MTHLSITEGGPHWGPHVTDDQYGADTRSNAAPPSHAG